MSTTLSCISTVAIGASNCPLETIIWKSGGGPSFIVLCGASNRISRKSSSGEALEKAPVTLSPSMFNSPTSIGKYITLRLIFDANYVDSRRNLVSPSGVN